MAFYNATSYIQYLKVKIVYESMNCKLTIAILKEAFDQVMTVFMNCLFTRALSLLYLK